MFFKYIYRNLKKILTRKLNSVIEGLKDFNNDMEKIIKVCDNIKSFMET